MSLTKWQSTPQAAEESARKILNFYPTIPAQDPRAFAAALTEILTNYPPSVLSRAASSAGICSHVAYPNLAKIREFLDAWRDEYLTELEREERRNRKALPEPPANSPEVDARIAKGLKELSDHLKSGFSPSSI